jgi:hypothetical protein
MLLDGVRVYLVITQTITEKLDECIQLWASKNTTVRPFHTCTPGHQIGVFRTRNNKSCYTRCNYPANYLTSMYGCYTPYISHQDEYLESEL